MFKKLVILSGAGMSAESGIRTFRDKDGWWKQYNPMELATPEAFARDPQLVLDFYNYRRDKVIKAEPNAGHVGLVDLENDFDVEIITQNVDDLHERAGSSKVTHLHGEIRKSRSTADPFLIYDIEGPDLNLGDTCEKGSQLRPHIVWFGEAVTAFEDALEITRQADIFVIIGTALAVYPAAGLVNYLQTNTPIFVINPDAGTNLFSSQVDIIETGAVEGLPILKRKLNEYV